MKTKIMFALAVAATALTVGPAEAQLQPGPNISPPPIAGPPLGEICVVDPAALVPGLLNVRASPGGWPIGLLGNGTQVVIRGYAGDWVDIGIGWVFRPLLACQPSPPLPQDAYAYAPQRPLLPRGRGLER
jgi:hypothetical protein